MRTKDRNDEQKLVLVNLKDANASAAIQENMKLQNMPRDNSI